MEAQSVYQSVVTSLFNLIRDEKLRTKIFIDFELRAKIIANINNLLSLEIDSSATFKDEKWSSNLAKAIVNITKEKIKFEKPENKVIIDIYADYSDLLTFCLNKYEVSKEKLTSEAIQISSKEITLSSKVTDEMKEKYGETDYTKIETNGKEVEVVGVGTEKPNLDVNNKNNNNNNFHSNFANGFNHNMFNQMGGTLPPPPLQDQRFFPFKTKLKHAYWYKIALSVFYGICGLTYLILVIFLTTGSIDLAKSDQSIANSSFSNLYTGNVEVLSLQRAILFGSNFTSNMNYIFLALNFILLIYIFYVMIKPPLTYKEQYWIPWFNIIFAGVFVFVNIFTLYLGNVISTISGSSSIFENFRNAINAAAQKMNTSVSDEDIQNVFSSIVEGNISSSIITLIKSLLWINFVILMICIVIIVVIVFLNPKMDREKVIYANQEYQKLMSELMQGRKYEMDQSIYEPEIYVKEFLDKRDNKKNKEQKDDKN
ncbi:hypothetical protein [Spiroplasma tabanidicola]|uniref:Transmembrane protein n=1 Tax=Spiroplasma tabanidicola TaxID=324079 RepID=A0A6I6C539_9MOLU|nr:hypothetical protein [Spiroplasma tabanidicola]QGS51957.1 hypothetical protein STABA_v1c05940 [Spiroplasma tabanidicola]